MEQSQNQLSQLIASHRNLLAAYNKLLDAAEGNEFRYPIDYEVINPKYYKKNLGFFDKIRRVGHITSYYTNNSSVIFFIKAIFKRIFQKNKKLFPDMFYDKRYAIKPVLRFFIKTHIRRQLTKLRSSYILEIATQGTEQNSLEIEKLRNVSDDIKNLIDILPDTRKYLAGLSGVGIVIMASLQFFNLNTYIIENIFAFVKENVELVSVVLYFIGFFIAMPFAGTFRASGLYFYSQNP